MNTPNISAFCEFLTTDNTINTFTGVGSTKILETIVEAVQLH